MSTFVTDPNCFDYDPSKRVYYAHGLVLGVDDFEQEQAHFVERGRQHQRVEHGYGTVCGLALSKRDGSFGPEILVSAGSAVNPCGETIHVPAAQCAKINGWLDTHAQDLTDALGPPPLPSPLPLELRLCYVECPTDPKPVPGTPCRSQEDAVAPSRIASDFRIELRLDPALTTSPAVTAEGAEWEAARRFGELLRSIEVAPGSNAGALDREALAAQVRQLADAPPPPQAIVLNEADAAEAIRYAQLVWITEVRPETTAGGTGCVTPPSDGDCVSLGRVSLILDDAGAVASADDIEFDESERPVLLPTRVLQEWPLRYRSLALVASDPLRPPTGGGRPTIPSPTVREELTSLRTAAAAGGTATSEAALRVGDAAGGDLALSFPNPTVRGFQGRMVSPADPADGALLVWRADTSRWEPMVYPAVEAPFGPHSIVAAGRFDQDGTPVGPVYNESFEVERLSSPNTDYRLRFDAYVQPGDGAKHNYIVLGAVEEPRGNPVPAFVKVRRYQTEVIRVGVEDGQNAAIEGEYVFQIVVFAYGALDSAPDNRRVIWPELPR